MIRATTTLLLATFLLSNLGLILSIHYCDDFAVSSSISMGSSVEHCDMMPDSEPKPPCENHPDRNTPQNECCNSETTEIHLDKAKLLQVVSTKTLDFSLISVVLWTIDSFEYLSNYSSLTLRLDNGSHPISPSGKDIPVFFQSFLL